jgi:hypothetical protein
VVVSGVSGHVVISGHVMLSASACGKGDVAYSMALSAAGDRLLSVSGVRGRLVLPCSLAQPARPGNPIAACRELRQLGMRRHRGVAHDLLRYQREKVGELCKPRIRVFTSNWCS